jgi:threonine dehydratase
VLVPAGSAGLAAGLCAHFTDRVRVLAVEPERSSCLHQALAAGR